MVVSIGSERPNQCQRNNQTEKVAFGRDKGLKNIGFGQQQRETSSEALK